MATTTLSHPAARRCLIAKALNGGTSWMQTAAASWWVLGETGTAASVGVLAMLAILPEAIVSPIGGFLADRYRTVPLLSRLAALSIVAPATIAVLAEFDLLSVGLLYVLVLLGAIPRGLLSAPLMKALPMSVPPPLRTAILANGFAASNGAKFLGPLIGSGLVLLVGIEGVFILNALANAGMWLIFRVTRLPYEEELETPKLTAPTTAYVEGVRQGLGLRIARVVLLGGVVFFALVGPIQQLTATIAVSHGEEVGYVGLLMAAMALGGLIANPISRWRLSQGTAKRRLVDAGVLSMGLLLVLLGLSQSLIVDLLLLAAIGAATETVWIGAQSTLVNDLPAEVSGRMLGVLVGGTTAAIGVSAFLMSWLFDAVGVDTALVLLGLAAMIYSAIHLAYFRSVHHQR